MLATPHSFTAVSSEREAPDIETASDGYARRFDGDVGAWFLDVQKNLVLDLLTPWPHASVLEVGGGHAQLAGALAASGYDVTIQGSDPLCRERLDRLLPAGSFHFVTSDLPRLPFPDRSFDVVLAVRLLTHMSRWREMVAEMCRVASHAVIVDYPDLQSFNLLYGPLFTWKKAMEGNTRMFLTFRSREIPAELARHGFGRRTVRRQFFVPMVVHRALGHAGLSRAMEKVSGALGLTRALGSPVILRAARE